MFGEFRLGYAVLGPTEARVALILANTIAILIGPFRFQLLGQSVTLFDVLGTIGVLAMIMLLLVRIGGNLRTLGRLEPPRRPT